MPTNRSAWRLQPMPADWHAEVVDRAGTILGRSRNADRFVGIALPSGAPRADGLHAATALEGEPIYTAWSVAAPSGWAVGVGAPRSAIDRPLQGAVIAAVL